MFWPSTLKKGDYALFDCETRRALNPSRQGDELWEQRCAYLESKEWIPGWNEGIVRGPAPCDLLADAFARKQEGMVGEFLERETGIEPATFSLGS